MDAARADSSLGRWIARGLQISKIPKTLGVWKIQCSNDRFEKGQSRLQVEPGKPGAEVSKEKNYKSKKKFAYRMCTGWPTTAMPKPSCLSERAFSRSMVVMWWPVLMWLVAGSDVIWCVFILCDAISCVVGCHVVHCDVMWCPLMWWAVICCEVMRCKGWDLMSLWCDVAGCDVTLCGSKWLCGAVLHRSIPYYTVLQSTSPVLLCTTQYYSSTTPSYKVLLQYYSVLQSTTPVLRCTTKSSTILYYKVLLQYYSVLQSSTTPVLFCTTKYYSSTTLYRKVLLQYYSVLQSTTPVLVCTTKYYFSTTLWLSWLILVTYETSFTISGATGVIHQRHQILHLARKTTLMSDVRHIWNAIYNARSNRCHPPTSPSTVPATKNDSHHWSS